MVKDAQILVTGAAGFIGTALSKALLEKGYRVLAVDMRAPALTHERLTFVSLDLAHEKLPSALDGEISGVIHLAGKNIFGRWSPSFKQAVYDSRIVSTRNLVNTFAAWSVKPEVYLSASAFGYYGDKGEASVDEALPVGEDFGAKVCADLEREVERASLMDIRTIHIRTAHVLGRGGLLAPLFLPFRLGLGATLGRGSGWLPWVHIDDIVSLYIYALEHEAVLGPINSAAPEAVRQKDFMQHFARVMHRPLLFAIPIFMLRIRYGELADSFDNSVKMNSQKIADLGFVHRYQKLDDALRAVILS